MKTIIYLLILLMTALMSQTIKNSDCAATCEPVQNEVKKANFKIPSDLHKVSCETV